MIVVCITVARNEIAEPQVVGTSVGIGADEIKKAMPVKNTENVQAVERKEDQNASVMSYATLNDGTHNIMYVSEDGFYDNPYSLGGNAYR
ncbi:hypothetical protein ALC53_05431 [Atta colombica]|uniref:Uncharacterized protein n=1 Tax=Atta colombica TaxID=520822 RepID=A0A195BHN9_9HYME|nr:hypothetical protein ALC53_05431 [Atta colombica]